MDDDHNFDTPAEAAAVPAGCVRISAIITPPIIRVASERTPDI
jgi:hypothetical protein